MSIFAPLKKILFGHVPAPREGARPLIVTAEVVELFPHPKADRLQLVSLSTGVARITPVVCGATNFAVGDIVALALPGATIPRNIHSDAHETFVLEKVVLRGVESQGMLCSGFELGLRDTPETREEGILIFPKGTKLGVDVFSVKR
jgi:phenylalanyl-tRNA synthetase beta chain